MIQTHPLPEIYAYFSAHLRSSNCFKLLFLLAFQSASSYLLLWRHILIYQNTRSRWQAPVHVLMLKFHWPKLRIHKTTCFYYETAAMLTVFHLTRLQLVRQINILGVETIIIAERVSVRQLLRVVFSQYAYVHTYVVN